MRKKAVKFFFIMTEKVQHCLKMKANYVCKIIKIVFFSNIVGAKNCVCMS